MWLAVGALIVALAALVALGVSNAFATADTAGQQQQQIEPVIGGTPTPTPTPSAPATPSTDPATTPAPSPVPAPPPDDLDDDDDVDDDPDDDLDPAD